MTHRNEIRKCKGRVGGRVKEARENTSEKYKLEK